MFGPVLCRQLWKGSLNHFLTVKESQVLALLAPHAKKKKNLDFDLFYNNKTKKIVETTFLKVKIIMHGP